MKRHIVVFLRNIGLYHPARWVYTRSITAYWHLYSLITNRDQSFLEQYQTQHKTHKLHLGCGLNYLEGWLNTDLMPDEKRVYLNVTKKFPFPDASFDYAYTEHVIEHMPYKDGKNMLEQSFRVLKPGGTLRVVTPDILFLIGLYQDDKKKLHSDYIAWNAELFIGEKAPHCALSVVNNYVRDWGHQYIYDVPVLKKTLEECGFENVKECKLGQSDSADLQNLENASRHPDGFLALESLILEAQKPKN